MLRAVGAYKYDYLSMERDFVTRTPKPSVRQVALDHGVPAASISVVQTYARTNDWEGKWLRAHDKSAAKVEERLADEIALNQLREVEVRNNAVEFIDEAITSARAALKETHFVKERDGSGKEIYVERSKHPATIPQVNTLLERLANVFGGQLAPAGVAGDGSGGEQLTDGITGFLAALAQSGGGTDSLVAVARLARRGAGELEPRRVGAGTGRDPAALGED